MDDVEEVSVFEQSFLEKYTEKMRAQDRYSYIQSEYVEKTEENIRKLNKWNVRTHDKQKHVENTIKSMSNTLGFSMDI
mgnify:CR=1 FL=1